MFDLTFEMLRPSFICLVFPAFFPLSVFFVILTAPIPAAGNLYSRESSATDLDSTPAEFPSLKLRATFMEFVVSSSTTGLKPLNLLIFLGFLMILGFVVKFFRFVPYRHHSQVYQLVALFAASLTIILILDRILAFEAGHLSMHRFLQYFLAGGICAFVTHAFCTPIDVIKTRMQTNPSEFSGIVNAFRKIISEEGMHTLLKGFGATASGYFLHGAFKYSFYEVFKLLFSDSPNSAVKPPLPVAALSGLIAECIACIFLCPLEAIRIRSVADSTFPSGVLSGLSLLFKTEGFHGWFKGLVAMLLKQVPYTVGQFISFEISVTFIRSAVHASVGVQNAKSSVAFISTVAGFLAGITAAVISHPGDTILSKVNQDQSDASAFSQIASVVRATGFLGIFAGLVPRLLQVSCMVGGQFMIYDSIKLWCGITPASALRPYGQPPAVDSAILPAVQSMAPVHLHKINPSELK